MQAHSRSIHGGTLQVCICRHTLGLYMQAHLRSIHRGTSRSIHEGIPTATSATMYHINLHNFFMIWVTSSAAVTGAILVIFTPSLVISLSSSSSSITPIGQVIFCCTWYCLAVVATLMARTLDLSEADVSLSFSLNKQSSVGRTQPGVLVIVEHTHPADRKDPVLG